MIDVIAPGKYVLAVSGGVDSMALLDMLVHSPDLELVVAHYDHGIREDSAEDRKLTQQVAAQHNLSYIYEEGNLGAQASEAMARTARYDFLRRAMAQHGAQAIITAHHQDDLLETILLNMLRGTNRRGLSSLRSTNEIVRPFLQLPKAEIVRYATNHKLAWREDSTNQDVRYRRNHVRATIMPKLTFDRRRYLLDLHRRMTKLNGEIDQALAEFFALQDDAQTMDRAQFIQLPHAVSREVMAEFIRANSARSIDRIALEQLVAKAKTARPNTSHDIDSQTVLKVSTKTLHITTRFLS